MSLQLHTIASENAEVFKEGLSEAIKELAAAKDRPHLSALADKVFFKYPVQDLKGRPWSDVFGLLNQHWQLLKSWSGKKPQVQVFNPSLEEHGWMCPHTVVVLLQKDMPFLVDSVRIELNRRGISTHAINSCVLSVDRGSKSQFKKFSDQDGSREALIYLEISTHADDAELADLQQSITDVLLEVDRVVADHQSMLARVGECRDSLAKNAPDISAAKREESVAFLDWLSDNHFTFIGCSEHVFSERSAERCLQEDAEKRLGLAVNFEHCKGVLESQMDPGVERFHLSPSPMVFAKSGIHSRVHRYAYTDFIAVKKYNDNAEVVGEYRFWGLYTSPVYTQSPSLIPLVRQKVSELYDLSGLHPDTHDGKHFKQIIETYPRDELLQASTSELHQTISGVASINERYQVRLFMRADPYGNFVNVLLYVPKDVFTTRLRMKIQELISKQLGASELDFNTHFSESVLARVHLVFRVEARQGQEFNQAELEQQVIELTRTWDNQLHDALIDSVGEDQGRRLFTSFVDGFSDGYRENFDGRTAVNDIQTISELSDDSSVAMSFYQPPGVDTSVMRFKIFHLNERLELSAVIPVLENLGLRVLGEHPYKLSRQVDGRNQDIWLHDFTLKFGLDIRVDVHAVKEQFKQAFEAIWRGRAHSDRFNRLVLGAQLDWREVRVLRAYAKYLKQTQFNFSHNYIADTLASHLDITRNLLALFKLSFDPDLQKKGVEDKITALEEVIIEALDQVSSLNEDQIIRRYLDLMNATLRTNFFVVDHGEHREYLSFKFAPRQLDGIPNPKPLYEIFVFSPRVEGVHLRMGSVARGGLRWSDRSEDYRTEVLGLVKAQAVKNAVIVPSGAKGGFIAKRLPEGGSRQEVFEEGVACYKLFIRGLLDVTDNLVDGQLVPPSNVVRRDGDDPYLVVAADKGTATFSDIANQISIDYGHWLGDAFASGGSQGYDHKGMGITAKGAWVSVQRHFRERGIDVQKEDFNVIAVGDMAGDVFGNGMLLSEHICLQAAFNHLHIFIDPSPKSAESFKERSRLFANPSEAGWDNYNAKLISKGGGVFLRSAKSIAISPEMKKAFDIEADKLSPNALITELLKAPVDLIWNGGIGTYIKASSETHADVGDKANDTLRVNGSELRAQVFGEGGNLGMTQRGRVEFCQIGGACNTDFIDNAAGVDCSDHEVNIKILLGSLVAAGDMTEKQRNQLLEKMTDAVSTLVLKNNYRQTQAISIAEGEVDYRVKEYVRFVGHLEASGRLDRGLEFLPEDEQIFERQSQSKGACLTRPEISVLVSYAKMELKEQLAASDLPDDPYIREIAANAFPGQLREKYRENILGHRLHREIVATQVANNMVNNMGISFSRRLIESAGSEAGQVAKAYICARDIFSQEDFLEQVEALDHQVDARVQSHLMRIMMRRVRRAVRWFLRNRRSNLDVAAEINTFKQAIEDIYLQLPKYLNTEPGKDFADRRDDFVAKGVPEDLAAHAAIPTNLYSGLSVVEVVLETGESLERVMAMYSALSDCLQLNFFANQLGSLGVDSYWQSMARESFLDDLERQVRTMAVGLLKWLDPKCEAQTLVTQWAEQQKTLVDRWKIMVSDLHVASNADYAMFSVAMRELLDLAQATKHCVGPLCPVDLTSENE